MRLDKLLAHTGYGTRKEVKQLINSGKVLVNGELVKKGGSLINLNEDEVRVWDDLVQYQMYTYLILNKPKGIISATEDDFHETVIDWIGTEYAHLKLFPVGRLDIDTTGLLLLTNNGHLSHKLLSPKRHVSKRYAALIKGIVIEDTIEKFAEGLNLGGFTTLPAKLDILSVDEEKQQSRIEVEIQEGKFHQVKRMFDKFGYEVLTLHRLSMGPLILPDDLAIGEFRELNGEEWRLLEPYGIE